MEKFKATQRRGTLKRRTRDFYNAPLLTRLCADTLDWQKPADAIVVSLKCRASKNTLQQRHGVLKQVYTSSYILNTTWVPRATANPHADSITIDAADACIATGRSSFGNQRCRRKTS